jgi:hypothetical protein
VFVLPLSSHFVRFTLPKLNQTAVNDMTSMNIAPSYKLLQLPNELLHEVAFRLATTELRIFSQVNHQLHDFVINFLARYRHNTAILRLPANILHNIIYQQLDDY